MMLRAFFRPYKAARCGLPTKEENMAYTISTIDELKGKPVHELHAIFRKAAHVAATQEACPQERAAAEKTMTNIRRVLARPTGPG